MDEGSVHGGSREGDSAGPQVGEGHGQPVVSAVPQMQRLSVQLHLKELKETKQNRVGLDLTQRHVASLPSGSADARPLWFPGAERGPDVF